MRHSIAQERCLALRVHLTPIAQVELVPPAAALRFRSPEPAVRKVGPLLDETVKTLVVAYGLLLSFAVQQSSGYNVFDELVLHEIFCPRGWLVTVVAGCNAGVIMGHVLDAVLVALTSSENTLLVDGIPERILVVD